MKLKDIVGELAIQKADTIVSGNFEFCSITEVNEHGAVWSSEFGVWGSEPCVLH